MKSLIFGLTSILLLAFMVLKSESNISFWNIHSLLIVIGGTIAVLFMATPASVLKNLSACLVAFFQPEESISDYGLVLGQLSKNRNTTIQTRNALLNYAADLWKQGVEQELFTVLISEKRREIELKNFDSVQTMKNLSKYPPALGMTGTVIGMMGLFADLDRNKEAIGQNLSVTLTATFLGLILANLIISPLADRMQIQQARAQQLNSHLNEILLLINRGESKTLIEGEIHGRSA